ncbi:MAG: PAS domain S-box protein, partial [Microcoleus sp. SM1_3_4]|nr:PAS domain S-box protein [Microcoleus sp. SM1_3_4]
MREALEETKELFLAFADSMPVPLVVSSLATGTILYCNDLCDLAFGVTASEFIDRQHAETLYSNPADRRQLLEVLARDGYVREAEVRLKKADGTEFWATVSMA